MIDYVALWPTLPHQALNIPHVYRLAILKPSMYEKAGDFPRLPPRQELRFLRDRPVGAQARTRGESSTCLRTTQSRNQRSPPRTHG